MSVLDLTNLSYKLNAYSVSQHIERACCQILRVSHNFYYSSIEMCLCMWCVRLCVSDLILASGFKQLFEFMKFYAIVRG